MTYLHLSACLFLFAATGGIAGQRLNFNADWRFTKDDPEGAARPEFDDRGWERVSTPHTFNDGDTFDDWSLPGHRGEQNQWSGRTWYRKTFTLPAHFAGKHVYIEFEAVRQVAEVYLNGRFLGTCKTGFTPFGFDLTPHLRFDGINVLAVMCDNRFMKDPLAPEGSGKEGGATLSLARLSAQVNAAIPEDLDALRADQIPWNNPHWHPAHGGIYRNVSLHVADPLHISLPLYSYLRTVGPYAYATGISTQSATVHLEVPVENGRRNTETVAMKAEVLDQNGRTVLTLRETCGIPAGTNKSFTASGTLERPQLWEPDSPYLYRIVLSLEANGQVVDTAQIPLGLRTVRWDARTGFYINGHHLKLRGWGQKPTDEWPGLGAAQPDWLHFYTLKLMKEAGANWVRWGHCLAGPAQINACDALGLGVEQPGVDGESDTRGAAWTLRTSAFRDTLIYYRNHPSILIWEGGNQKVSVAHARELRACLEQYDPHIGRAYAYRRADQAMAPFLDVGIGTEGGRELASLPVVEGEYDREESPRRVWDDYSPPRFGYPEARGMTYDLNSEQYAVNQVSQFVSKLGRPDHCGGANWIFSDSTSGGRLPCEVARASGEVDGVRLPKEAYFACQAMFRADPQVHLLGHWTYPAGTRKNVHIVSNAEQVEFFVNGRSLGRVDPADRYLFTFTNVVWEPGEIKAVAFRQGRAVATQSKRTTGTPVALRLTSITGPAGLQADGADVALLDVEAVDSKGERCPTVEQRVDFQLEGPATWLGGYNSGKTNSIRKTGLDLECGINRVAVRATRSAGEITVAVRAEGLKPASIVLRSLPFEAPGGLATNLPAVPPVSISRRQVLPAAIDSLVAAPPGRPAGEMAGRFTRSFSYSGPAASVHVECNAGPGSNLYVDRDCAMAGLPPPLAGADWVQTAQADNRYSAVDLVELAVGRGTVVWVAHDDRLARPAWLARLFQPTGLSLLANGYRMSLFQRPILRDESLTLGSNTENPQDPAGNMYAIFISPAAGELDSRRDRTSLR